MSGYKGVIISSQAGIKAGGPPQWFREEGGNGRLEVLLRWLQGQGILGNLGAVGVNRMLRPCSNGSLIIGLIVTGRIRITIRTIVIIIIITIMSIIIISMTSSIIIVIIIIIIIIIKLSTYIDTRSMKQVPSRGDVSDRGIRIIVNGIGGISYRMAGVITLVSLTSVGT